MAKLTDAVVEWNTHMIVITELNNTKCELERVKQENERLSKLLSKRILVVEDGSVDIDQLEEDGFYVIVYRAGSKPPMWLTHQHEDKGE